MLPQPEQEDDDGGSNRVIEVTNDIPEEIKPEFNEDADDEAGNDWMQDALVAVKVKPSDEDKRVQV